MPNICTGGQRFIRRRCKIEIKVNFSPKNHFTTFFCIFSEGRFCNIRPKSSKDLLMMMMIEDNDDEEEDDDGQ